MTLTSGMDVNLARTFLTVAEFTVEAGQRSPFVLTWYPSNQKTPPAIDPEQSLGETCTFKGSAPRLLS